MEKSESYENVMQILEELNDDNVISVDPSNHLDDNYKSFRFEYAFESITSGSAFKRRNSDG